MSAVEIAVASVALIRLAELAYAQRNTERLLDRGGIEHGAQHYRLFVLLHAAWLIALLAVVPAETSVNWPLIGLFGALQLARIWVIGSLGPYWTTRVITVPNEPLVAHGPYRWCRHPNYVIVAAEIAVLPLAFGAWAVALAFSLLNAALLGHRVRVEEAALAARRKTASQA
jgi:methyltransferase